MTWPNRALSLPRRQLSVDPQPTPDRAGVRYYGGSVRVERSMHSSNPRAFSTMLFDRDSGTVGKPVVQEVKPRRRSY